MFSSKPSSYCLRISDKNIIVLSKISEGSFGMIYKAIDEKSKENYALKVQHYQSEEQFHCILNEYELQKKCSTYEGVVNVFGLGHNKKNKKVYILMEYCDGSLVNDMNNSFKNKFSDKTITEIFVKLVENVSYIHSLKIIHRDLKPENILKKNGMWKLADFGSATTKRYLNLEKMNSDELNIVIDDLEKNTTPIYRAPEICDLYRKDPINEEIDVWALGCILFKLCTFTDAFNEGVNLQILNLKYKWPENINQKFKDIVEFIFVQNPMQRPTAREVLGEVYRQFPDLVDDKWKINVEKKEFKKQESFELFSGFNCKTKQIEINMENSFNNETKLTEFTFEEDEEKIKGLFSPYDEVIKPGKNSITSNDPFSLFNESTTKNTVDTNNTVNPFNTNNTVDPFNANNTVNTFNTNNTVDPFNTNNTVDPFETHNKNDPFNM